MISLAAVAIGALVLTGCAGSKTDGGQASQPGAQEGPIGQVKGGAATELLDSGIRTIDVREPSEYQSGHIPGSELVPLGTVASASGSWDKDEPLLLVCRSGNRSTQAATYLARQGFKKLYNLDGGMMSWSGASISGANQGQWK